MYHSISVICLPDWPSTGRRLAAGCKAQMPNSYSSSASIEFVTRLMFAVPACDHVQGAVQGAQCCCGCCLRQEGGGGVGLVLVGPQGLSSSPSAQRVSWTRVFWQGKNIPHCILHHRVEITPPGHVYLGEASMPSVLYTILHLRLLVYETSVFPAGHHLRLNSLP